MWYYVFMKNIYTPREFGALIGRAVITLQKWDRVGQLVAFRTPTNRTGGVVCQCAKPFSVDERDGGFEEGKKFL
jgi:hypothetical protein